MNEVLFEKYVKYMEKGIRDRDTEINRQLELLPLCYYYTQSLVENQMSIDIRLTNLHIYF